MVDLRELSDGERKVMRLLANGHTVGEVAEKLGNSPNTISTHIARAIRKLKARHKDHAVALVARQFWLEDLADGR